MSQSESTVPFAGIQNHHKKTELDRLYEPLRKVLVSPDISLYHQIQNPQTADSSSIPTNFVRFSKGQCLNIKQHIKIPVSQDLIPSTNLQKISKNKYRIIDTSEKMHKIISSEEMNEIIKKNAPRMQILYEFADRKKEFTGSRKRIHTKSVRSLHRGFSISTKKSQQSQSCNNISMNCLKFRNKFQNTDKLYDPLRKIIQIPNAPVINQFHSPKAFLFSKLPSNYNRLSFCENLQIQKQTLIPMNVQLKPTNNIENIKEKKFRIINAYEKTIGKQLTYQEVQKIISSRPKDQVIVYQLTKIQEQINQQRQNSTSKQEKTTKPKSSTFYSMVTISNHKQQIFNNKKVRKNCVNYDQGVTQFNERVIARTKNHVENPEIKGLAKCLSSNNLYHKNQDNDNILSFKNPKKAINISIRKKPSFKNVLLKGSKSQKCLINYEEQYTIQQNNDKYEQNSEQQMQNEKHKNLSDSMKNIEKLFILALPQHQPQQQQEQQLEEKIQVSEKKQFRLFTEKDSVFESIQSKLQESQSKILPNTDYKKADNTPQTNFASSQHVVQSLQSFKEDQVKE